MNEAEEWRPVVGYDGLYEVSSLGRVRSLPKTVRSRWGCTRRVPGANLRPDTSGLGHARIYLYRHGGRRKVLVHRLVAEAFIPNPEGYPLVRHRDDDPSNNNVGNLQWGTHSDNMKDSVRNGNHVEARKTHCPKGHEYTTENTFVNSKGFRRCLRCRLDRRSGGLPAGDPRHGTHNGYGNLGCRCPECVQAGGYPNKRGGAGDDVSKTKRQR